MTGGVRPGRAPGAPCRPPPAQPGDPEMEIDIKGLIRKLNRSCTRSLEAAAGLCVSRGHYEVTVEHMLQMMLEDTGGDVEPILHHFGVNATSLTRAVQHGLERQRAGNTGRPVFSPLLLQWIQD